MRPAVFLDRDGVINRVIWRDGKPASPRTLDELVLEDGVPDAVARLHAAGLLVFVVTNQPDVRRGLLDGAVLDRMCDRLHATLALHAVRACRHDDRDGCTCRKPRPGMLLDLAAEFGVDLHRSWMIGDQDRDMQCGHAAGCTTIQLARPYNTGAGADHRVDDLVQAASLVIAAAIPPSSHPPAGARHV